MLVKLEDVCVKDSSNIAQKDIENLEGDYPIYGASGFIKNINTYKQEKDYIAIVKDGAGVGRAMLLPAKSSVIGTLQYILPKDNIVPTFLFYAISSLNLNKYANGATIPHIYFKDYKNEYFNLPSFEEQHRIVAILDQVNDLISLRNQQLEQLDLLIKSRFSEIFKLKNYPLKTLKECSVFIDYRGHTPVVSDTGTIRMINAKSVGKGFFKYIDEYVSEETYNSWMHRGFGEPGDVLIVTEGHTFGNVCRIPKDLTKFALGQRVITIRGINNLINNVYLSSYMQLDEFFQKINKYKTGGTAQGIRSKDLITITIPIPPLALQNQFAAFVEEVEKEKATVKQSLEQLDILKKKLMQEYFG